MKTEKILELGELLANKIIDSIREIDNEEDITTLQAGVILAAAAPMVMNACVLDSKEDMMGGNQALVRLTALYLLNEQSGGDIQ